MLANERRQLIAVRTALNDAAGLYVVACCKFGLDRLAFGIIDAKLGMFPKSLEPEAIVERNLTPIERVELTKRDPIIAKLNGS